MITPFPYPLSLDALRSFCHPRHDHPFHAPLRHGDGLAACNGYIALRANRGQWLDREHPEATGDALRRLDAVPWASHSTLPGPGWIPLDDHRGRLLSRPIAVWDDKGNLNPSPVWLIASTVRVRLSLLILLSRLPRAEIHPPATSSRPLAFRFSGGIGFLSSLSPETPFSFHLCPPRRDPLTGHESPSHIRKPIFQGGPGFKDWPPPEPLD